MTTQVDPHFEALLVYLKEARGFDFTGYKRSSPRLAAVNRRGRSLHVRVVCTPLSGVDGAILAMEPDEG